MFNLPFFIDGENLVITAYDVIRRETRRYNRESNDAELGNYVKGVVDLQTELYKNAQICLIKRKKCYRIPTIRNIFRKQFNN